MDYKDTLNLPKTNFKMRANLAQNEPLIQKDWQKNKLYEKVLKKNQKKKHYVIHDGPPYANNDIHAGHALNKVLKDFIIRFKTMQGYYVDFIPGWDTHGLPIEVEITKKKGVNRKELSISEFRKLCHKFALKNVELQKKQFMRLGILARWDNPYLTLNKDYEANQIEVFADLVKKGLIYRGLKPIYWSYSSESALAEAEIEYKDIESDSIYFSFPCVDNDLNLLVWTTTPWTLPANLAVCLNPAYTYNVCQFNNKKYLIEESLTKKVLEELGIKKYKVIKQISGAKLENIKYKHPLFNRVSPVILGMHVTQENGTGLVHTAPGHGADDYNVGVKYNLDILSPIDASGYLTKEAKPYDGLFYEKANEVIIKDLKKKGCLLKASKIVHSYPHDWRTKKPVIFRATPQWFCSLDPIRKDILKALDKVEMFKPKWGKIRLENMIKERDDWTISRQRYWGVPIPIFYCENGEPILDEKIIKNVANLFRKHGSDIWYEKDAKDLLPKGYKNPNSPNGRFIKELDTMDVWFDSGTSFKILNNKQSEFYLEGSDQYRGWFNSSLITSVAVNNKAPYKRLISHGFVQDKNGQKMSKSLGNVVDPNILVSKHGADVFRLWVASVDSESDVRLSDDAFLQISDSYRKIRNTIRFLLGNISDFNPNKDYISYSMRGNLHKVMTMKLYNLIDKTLTHYDNFEFDKAFREMMPFIINDVSAFYLDFVKDTLYILEPNNHERRQCQSTLYDILISILTLLTPIIPHTTEQAYTHLKYKKHSSIYLEDMPKRNKIINPELLDDFLLFQEVRDKVLIELEKARNDKIITKSLMAEIKIHLPKKNLNAINNLTNQINDLFKVAKVTFKEAKTIKVTVQASNLPSCERCWNLVDEVNKDGVCKRCSEVLEKLK